MLALCIAVLMTVLWGYAQQVRAHAERAAVQSTLGALRTALVLDAVHRMMTPSAPSVFSALADATPLQAPNPFLLLQQAASNYAGEVPAALVQEVSPGQWVFDKRCGCVGYKPQDPGVLDAPIGVQAVWFVVNTAEGVPQLKPIQPYVWAGIVLE